MPQLPPPVRPGRRRPTRDRLRGDAGQAGLLVGLLVLALAVTAAALVSALGGAVAERTRARTAGDAAALAGVSGGRHSAAVVARANGGDLIEFAVDGDVVEVTVVVGSTRATSRAASSPPPGGADGPAVTRAIAGPTGVVAGPSRHCSEPVPVPDPCAAQRHH